MKLLASLSMSLWLPVMAQAASYGTPVFTTTPGTVSITNWFWAGLPSDIYTISYSGAVATSLGAPELVGQPLTLYYSNGGTTAEIGPMSLEIGGTEIALDAGSDPFTMIVLPPYLEPEPGTFTYPGIFAGFGPRSTPFPDFTLAFDLGAALPVKTGFLYCSADDSFCEFSDIAGLVEIGGIPVGVEYGIDYVEGVLGDTAISFATEGGAPLPPVPLPAAGLLLAGGIAALGTLRRRRGACQGSIPPA